ncbi:hypothetical protein G7077_11615 [Sphingomonas piscis]|uniref:Polysaccharide biosynthesis protein C-terminal domain-containing protein n=1 Tax=Sphingomonas piscis TaxID=2714943 RepID=A0A6G7YRT6_9SPHN|nr:hypothetical protein [Sphingomonas piscis]QIK79455.1 hypothetical protein G7077_11615 [Sphingomonas piscis]
MPSLSALLTKRGIAGSASLLLRLASLAGKLALSLYMGKFFPLSELGLYGLAFGAVMLAIVLLGFRVDYILAREILGMDEDRQRRAGMSVLALYLGSFVLAAPLAVLALTTSGEGGSVRFLLLIYLLCGVEAYANFLYTITIALKRPALANALFFIRSGLWTAPAMVISYLDPNYRTVGFVLGCWLAGAGTSVVLNLWFMRRQLLGRIGLIAEGWLEMRAVIGGAFLVWIGSVAVTLGQYLDRFVLASYLTLEDVGVATFYTSFTSAALTLVQSATTTVTFPVLIEHFDAGDMDRFKRELRKTAVTAAALCFVILLGLAGAMLLMGGTLGKPELLAAFPAFVLLLIATFIRTHAETLYYGLFVERQHRAIWLGNLLFLAVSLLLNLLLVPMLGLNGLGIAAIVAALAIYLWRSLALRRGPAATDLRRGSADAEWRVASEGEEPAA